MPCIWQSKARLLVTFGGLNVMSYVKSDALCTPRHQQVCQCITCAPVGSSFYQCGNAELPLEKLPLAEMILEGCQPKVLQQYEHTCTQGSSNVHRSSLPLPQCTPMCSSSMYSTSPVCPPMCTIVYQFCSSVLSVHNPSLPLVEIIPKGCQVPANPATGSSSLSSVLM